VNIRVFENKVLLAQAAAADAATVIRTSIRNQGKARIIAATGASQFEFLDELTRAAGIDWTQVEMFHLDEYLGLPLTHPASFRKYLLERLVSKTGITHYHLLDGMRNPAEVMAEVNAEIGKAPIDVAFVGVGENGHLAFNDPPADFETEQPYIVVELDEACRKQQLGEGWFKTLEEVPRRAISMTVKQILKARQIICIVPDLRKAQAVAACFGGEEVSPEAPASILRNHPCATVYVDRDSASRLRPPESTPAGFSIR
jgi:glucosamine-6-phosphate deaminase